MDFLPAGRWWQEGSCGVVLAPVPGHPSLYETMVRVGGSLQACWEKGLRMHTLSCGHRTRGDTIVPLGTLGSMVSCVTFGAVSVDAYRRCCTRGPGAHGWKGQGRDPCGLCPAQWPVRRGLGCGSIKAEEPSPGKAMRGLQGLGWLRGSNKGG